MRCPRCEFENMPGQTKCFKCGSVLEGPKEINVHPPRMAGWKRPIRSVRRWIRGTTGIPNLKIEIPTPGKRTFKCFGGLILSIVPGLAHLLDRRFKEIRWYFLAWLILLLGSLFLYATTTGLLLAGLAVGLHTWIAVHHTVIRELKEFGPRLFAMIFLMILIGILYWSVQRVFLADITTGYTTLTIPYYNVESGDCLLARYSHAQEHPLPRGSLTLARMRSVGVYQGRAREVGGFGPPMIVQIIGLPGEKLEIIEGTFFIDGQLLDTERYPVPQWLRTREISVKIPEDSYFVSTEYNVDRRGRGLDERTILAACLIRSEDISARAFMRWLPVGKRGFLE